MDGLRSIMLLRQGDTIFIARMKMPCARRRIIPISPMARDPLLLRRHTVFDEIDRPLKFTKVYCVSARFMPILEPHRGMR